MTSNERNNDKDNYFVIVPNRRRIGHVNVNCMYSNTSLTGRGQWGGGCPKMVQLALSKGTGEDGNSLPCTEPPFQVRGLFFFSFCNSLCIFEYYNT